jgi:hypothetical protein
MRDDATLPFPYESQSFKFVNSLIHELPFWKQCNVQQCVAYDSIPLTLVLAILFTP